jgi:hypothetical protein
MPPKKTKKTKEEVAAEKARRAEEARLAEEGAAAAACGRLQHTVMCHAPPSCRPGCFACHHSSAIPTLLCHYYASVTACIALIRVLCKTFLQTLYIYAERLRQEETARKLAEQVELRRLELLREYESTRDARLRDER